MNFCLSQYFEGKTKLVDQIPALIPAHDCYIEPLGGMASVLFNKVPSRVEVYNDRYGDLVNFFMCVKTDAMKLRTEIEKMPYSRKIYRRVLEDFKDKDVENPLALEYVRAARFFYIMNTGFGAKPAIHQSLGSFGYAKKQRNRARALWRKTSILEGATERLRNVIIECLDFADCIKRYDTPNSVFYCDPPYYASDNPGISFTEEQHKQLADTLTSVKGKWILTYDDHPKVRELYDKYSLQYVDVPRTADKSLGVHTRLQHLIITNFCK